MGKLIGMYYIKIYFQSKKRKKLSNLPTGGIFPTEGSLPPNAYSLCQVRTISLFNTGTKVSQNTCYRLLISYMLKAKHNEC